MFKQVAHRLAYRAGIELRREPGLRSFLESRAIDLVLDVGANRGQFGAMLRKRGYSGKIWSFEPVGSAFADLSKRIAGDPKWSADHVAVGAQSGTIDIRVTRNDVFSSVLPPSEYGRDHYPSLECVGVENVPVVTIDSLLDRLDPATTFLKVDTQGFEKPVLDGAKDFLRTCAGVQLELPIERLYENSWTFSEAIVVMEKLGFLPAQFRLINPLRDDVASAVEFDCIFRRLT